VKLFGVQRRRKTTHELIETGKIKRAAPSKVARWVLTAWKAIKVLLSDLSRSVA